MRREPIRLAVTGKDFSPESELMIEPNAPPVWTAWGEWMWLILVLVGVYMEIWHFWNPHVPTFTGMIKRFCPWIVPRAALLGVLFYHFCIQPIVETLNKMGIKVF